MEERHIVSIDLGSSKIGLAVARIDGHNIEMIYYKETPSEGIARGSVSNVKKASESIRHAIATAEDTIHQKINFAVVNMPKYPVIQKSSVAEMERDGESCVEEGEIETLRSNAINDCALEDETTDKVFDAVAQSYSDEEDFQISEEDIIGRTSSRIEGNFNIYIGKKKGIVSIDSAFDMADASAGAKFFPAEAAAKAVLNEDEKQSGVALVDMGAGATSVAIYKNGILRYYDSIPFGGHLVTKDIQEVCHIGESLAENIKKAYGVCMPDRLYNLGDKIIQISGDKQNPGYELQVKFLSKIVTARMKEIIDAVLYLVQESGYADVLNAGFVLTGGASQIGNCRVMFKEISGLNVRMGYPKMLYTSEGSVDGINDTGAANAVGMMICARDRGQAGCTLPHEEYLRKEAELKKAAENEAREAAEKEQRAREMERLAREKAQREREAAEREAERKRIELENAAKTADMFGDDENVAAAEPEGKATKTTGTGTKPTGSGTKSPESKNPGGTKIPKEKGIKHWFGKVGNLFDSLTEEGDETV